MNQIIKDLTKEVDETIVKLNGKNKSLLVIKTDNSLGNNLFLKSLKRKGDDLGIRVVCHEFKDRNFYINTKGFDSVLVLKPKDKRLMKDYKILKTTSNIYKKDIEGHSQQATIAAIISVIQKIGKEKRILLLNRSRDLGMPLARELLQLNYTVEIGHSKSNFSEINNDIVIFATGKNQTDLYHKTNRSTWIIDVSDDIKAAAEDERYIKNIGALTTSYTLLRAALKE